MSATSSRAPLAPACDHAARHTPARTWVVSPVAVAVVAALALPLVTGCGEATDSASADADRGSKAAASWRDGLAEGVPADILNALSQSHAQVRESLGPHRLDVSSTVSMTPQPPEGKEPDANPEVGQHVVLPQAVVDKLTLVWSAADEAGPRFSLEQHNEQGRGRSIVVADDKLFAKLEHRGWTMHAVETDVHELWLDDAQRTAHDAVAFLLPAATVSTETVAGGGLAGGDAVRLTLSRGESSLKPDGTASWRDGVAFDALDATVLVDLNGGAWLSLEASARYHLRGSDGMPVTGVLEAKGSVTPADGGSLTVAPPSEVVALPERHRYEEERKRLLDGLVAP